MTRFSHPGPRDYAGAVPPLFIILLCVAYYGSYIGGGFNFADDGHYAQAAFEFAAGADPHAVKFGYGIAWFKVGELLFRLFGPNYALVQGFFYTVITLTAVLLWATVADRTGDRIWALAAAVPAVLVPAFPATAFYAFAALLNTRLLLRVAAERRRPSPSAAAWAGAGLSLTFQIRPDFGLVFAAVFAALLLASALTARRSRDVWEAAAAAALAFVACHIPLLIDAALRGYLDLVWSEYARYPEMLIRYVLTGSPTARPAGVDIPAEAGTLLARPSPAGLWRGDAAAREAAATIYGPVAVMAAFMLWTAAAWVRERADDARVAADGLAARMVLLAGAASSFPHYYLFRPDLAHVANFMPGLFALLGVFAYEVAVERSDDGRRRLRFFGSLVAVCLAAYAAYYVKIGLTTPGAGSIAADRGRDSRFVTPYGVNVRVTAEEARVLGALRDLVEENSRPGDPIVCVPFCPGVAFMTGRRMLFGEFYVDDAMLFLDPGWIDRAIERTRAARPGIVLAFDWSIHGTDISRFGVWANRYIAFLREAGYEATSMPGGTAWVAPKRAPGGGEAANDAGKK
jgi:hypothetical protein